MEYLGQVKYFLMCYDTKNIKQYNVLVYQANY